MSIEFGAEHGKNGKSKCERRNGQEKCLRIITRTNPMNEAAGESECAQPSIMKKTCEACARSKIKCDGKSPCYRCLRKGNACIYLLEQRRGRRPSKFYPIQSLTPPVATPSPLHMPVCERRWFRIVFSLFKYHHDEGSTSPGENWFAIKMSQLGQLLRVRDGHNSAAQCVQLLAWLFDHGIPVVSGHAATRAVLPKLVNLPQRSSCSIPALFDQNEQVLRLLGSIQVDGGAYTCSPELIKVFGYGARGSNFPHKGADDMQNFLPWGADVLCQICEDDSPALAYLRDVASALATSRKDDAEEITLHFRPMSIATTTSTTSIACLITCHVYSSISARFDLYQAPRSSLASNWFAMRHQLPLCLPDLELAPWTDNEEDWLPNLLNWAKRNQVI